MTKPSGIITLLTDFGLSDPYVGVMKGVLLQRCPGARLVDLTHQIPAHDVAAAAFWLERSYPWFPAGTVHLVVVDPGVGSERRALVVSAGEHLFVGPDNGVFSRVLATESSSMVRAFEAPALGVTQLSATFHGRDLFGPAAAELAAGTLQVTDLGVPCTPQYPDMVVPEPDASGRLHTRVLVVDQFGNLITDLPSSLLVGSKAWRVVIAGRSVPLVRTYADADRGECVALIGSFDTLEIAAREASAAAQLRVAPGAPVVIEPIAG